MTDIELAPLPEHTEAGEFTFDAHVFEHTDLVAYARVNMEPLIAEIEALRASKGATYIKYELLHAELAKSKARAERLAETLRDVVADMCEWGEPAKGAHVERIQRRLEDALRDHDQEGGVE